MQHTKPKCGIKCVAIGSGGMSWIGLALETVKAFGHSLCKPGWTELLIIFLACFLCCLFGCCCGLGWGLAISSYLGSLKGLAAGVALRTITTAAALAGNRLKGYRLSA